MVHHHTLCRLTAGVRDRTGVDTVVVLTRLLRGTVQVRPTINGEARHFGISRQAGRARADGSMTHRRADRLSAAGHIARPADRSTLLVAAGVAVQTVVVCAALDLEAGHIGVALEALLAGAHRLVVDHATEGVLAARARVLADAVDTGVRLTALVVRAAAGQDGGESFTTGVLVADVAVRTGADHGAHRQGVDDGTAGGLAARAQRYAERLALAGEAGVLGRTVLVLHTLRQGDWNALHVGIAGEANGAATLRLVVGHQTFSVARAGILLQAGIDAVPVAAGLVQRTLRIRPAANNHAAGRGERIPLVAGQAATVGLVSFRVALRKPTAGVLHQAGVDALPADAGLPIATIVVRLAADRLAGNLRIADEAGRTDAHRMMIFHKALGALATVTGVDALAINAGLAVGTVIVPSAAGRVGQLYRPTSGVLRVRHPTLPTGADHGAEGQAVHHRAACCHVTRREAEAGILAALVEAGRVVRAVAVHATLRLQVGDVRLLLGRAGDERIADPARRTRALGHVILHGAGGAGRAGVLIEAGVQAPVGDAGRVLGAVRVDAALHAQALLVGVAL